jgi:cytochrome P450
VDSGTTAPSSIDETLPHFDLYNPEHHERLWEILARAREACPVIKTDADTGYFVVTRYDDVRAVASDPTTFSSAEPLLRGLPVRLPPVSEDPPIHSEFRKLLNPYFSRSFLARYESDIRAAASDLLDPLLPAGRMEFMNEFALPYTANNLARVVLDETNQDRIKRAGAVGLRISTEGTPDAFVELAQIAGEFLRDRAASGQSHDGVLSAIVNGQIDGRPLTIEDQIGVCTTLFTGGLDTVRAALGSIAHHLARDPSLEDRVRDPDWSRSDLDEFLRLDPPITFLARTVTQDTEVNGCPMRQGDRLALHFASANRDSAHFEDAQSLHFDRDSNRHLTFGIGIHRCLGLHFARLQIEIAFDELLSRITNVRIPDGVDVKIANGAILTPEHLPIEFDLREPARAS